MARLHHDFFAEDTLQVAQALLGKYLVRRLDGEVLVGRITETEAYIGRCDKACHAYNYKRTARTAPLFLPAGHAYVYLIYGMYHCLNFVTEAEGEPAAVLLRAVEPVTGTDTMWSLRYGSKTATAYRLKNFLNGPGKVCKGFFITTAENQMDLDGDTLFLCDDLTDLGLETLPPVKERVCTGPRIGIDYAEEAKFFPWRFYLVPEEG